jgi:hypothetical protein
MLARKNHIMRVASWAKRDFQNEAVSRAFEPAIEEVLIPKWATCGRLGHVGKNEELRLRILQGKSDANVNFDDLRHFLLWLGFEERTRGSHHMFRRQGVRELINL